MEPMKSQIETMQLLVAALGAGLAAWGTLNMRPAHGDAKLAAQSMAQIRCGARLVSCSYEIPAAIASTTP